MVPAPSGNRGAPTKKRKLQTNDNVKSAEFDSPFLADSLNFKPEFLTNMIDLDLGTSAVSFRICYWNNMESQFLSPVGVPPHLRSEGIYRVHTSVYMICLPMELTYRWANVRSGGDSTFFGGCVPCGFQNVGSREWIFLEKWGFGNENFEKFGSRELEFRLKHDWKCINFLKIENGGHKRSALRVN